MSGAPVPTVLAVVRVQGVVTVAAMAHPAPTAEHVPTVVPAPIAQPRPIAPVWTGALVRSVLLGPNVQLAMHETHRSVSP